MQTLFVLIFNYFKTTILNSSSNSMFKTFSAGYLAFSKILASFLFQPDINTGSEGLLISRKDTWPTSCYLKMCKCMTCSYNYTHFWYILNFICMEEIFLSHPRFFYFLFFSGCLKASHGKLQRSKRDILNNVLGVNLLKYVKIAHNLTLY